MSAGSILARIVLDNPTRYHCGPSDPVTGHLSLTYRPPAASQSSNGPAQELFGPLVITLTFGGRAKTKIHKSNGNHSTTHRGRAPLFSQRHKIYDGRHSSKAGECVRFPFSLNFPAATQSLPGLDDFRQDARFQEEAGHPLPPTFDASNNGLRKSFKSFVEYRLKAEIRMPGIDITVLGLNQSGGTDEGIPILYEQPRLPASALANFRSRSFADSITLQNEHLLPEAERPTGFRQKAKFAFSSEKYPTYLFTIRGTVPSEVPVGQPLILELALHPDAVRCTAPIPPEVTIRWVRAELRQYITVRAEYGFLSSEESTKDSHLPLPCRIVEPSVPFGKANDWTKFVRTTGVVDAASSFSTWNICQMYMLQVEYRVSTAGKEKTCKHTFPIVVHPPVDGAGGGFAEAEASSSSAAAAVVAPTTALHSTPQDLQGALPSSSAPLDPATGLPEYERPPEYDQVLDMTAGNDAAAAESSSSQAAAKGKAAMVVAT
jgi:hypothetical protein